MNFQVTNALSQIKEYDILRCAQYNTASQWNQTLRKTYQKKPY